MKLGIGRFALNQLNLFRRLVVIVHLKEFSLELDKLTFDLIWEKSLIY
ncbi:Conserved hypothetical protein [Prochlorococcus marinus str. NATL2A]|uniref:Uncharacterized protein n=2 Tax=Prochlorococcus marinus TaxID=1219 RepID=A7MDB4_PROMT|nr:Conserved hypothetical protein [Prochlorococcus marinus str. NATL2A]AJW30287.1 hypothetical protein FA02_0016 [Prochlorococcus marinus str. P0902-H212]